MKKLIILLTLLFTIAIFSQNRTIIDPANSSTTVLDSAAVFTGGITEITLAGGWNSMSVSSYANHTSGVDGTLTIRFGTNDSDWVQTNSYTIATDTETDPIILPIITKYYQVLFTNGAEVQTEFRLSTILYSVDMSVGNALVTTGIANPKGNATSGGGNNTITSVEVLASSQTVKETTITNYTNGSILYYGFDNSVTASNGQPLNYLDTKTFTRDNLEDIWLISSSSTDVRYDWEN